MIIEYLDQYGKEKREDKKFKSRFEAETWAKSKGYTIIGMTNKEVIL